MCRGSVVFWIGSVAVAFPLSKEPPRPESTAALEVLTSSTSTTLAAWVWTFPSFSICSAGFSLPRMEPMLAICGPVLHKAPLPL